LLKFIGFIISFICFIALTFLWIFLTSSITYCIKKYFNLKVHKSNTLEYTIAFGIILEICLSIIYILIWPKEDYLSKIKIISIIQRGASYAAIFTPITSILGAVIGVKIRIPPWRFFMI